MSEELPSFHISQTSADTTFKNRTDSVFGCLDVLEKKHKEVAREFDAPEGSCSINPNSKTNNKISASRSKRGRLPKRVPDHVINPKNWTKYSLKDDGSYQTSKGLSAEQLNKKIAYDFLDELSQQRKQDFVKETDISNDDGDYKLVFHKPCPDDDSDQRPVKSVFNPSHGGHAKIMETYEVGGKRNLKKKSFEKNITEKPSNEVKLKFHAEQDNDFVDDDEADKNIESKIIFSGKEKISKRRIRKRRVDDDEHHT